MENPNYLSVFFFSCVHWACRNNLDKLNPFLSQLQCQLAGDISPKQTVVLAMEVSPPTTQFEKSHTKYDAWCFSLAWINTLLYVIFFQCADWRCPLADSKICLHYILFLLPPSMLPFEFAYDYQLLFYVYLQLL